MTPYKLSDEMTLWKPDPEVEALKQQPNWAAFHRECGRRGFYFDRPMKQGRGYVCVAFRTQQTAQGRGYVCVAFRTQQTAQGGWTAVKLAQGTGKTAKEAMEAAYRETGRGDEVTDRLWGVVTPEDEFADLF